MVAPAGKEADVSIGLAGAVRVCRHGRPITGPDLGSRKSRTLIKLLAVERGRTVPTWRIVEILWEDRPPARALENVATLVSRLRRVLGAAAIEGGREGYRLGSTVVVDLDVALGWTSQAEARVAAGEPGLALAAAARAADLLIGPWASYSSISGEGEGQWAEPARIELRELLRRNRLVTAEAALGVGDPGRAKVAAQALLAADPYDETACRLLMTAHQRLGEPAYALAVYAAFQQLLARELGADPAAETRALHLAILREDSPEPAAGVRPVDEPATEKLRLVGRRDELRQLQSAWSNAAAGRPSLVLLVGEAGIGKTCLADELIEFAGATGGTVLHARCYEAERSLFLQPVVEAIGVAFRDVSPEALITAAGEDSAVISRLIPAAGDVLRVARSADRTSPEVERRRAFEALAAFLRRLSERAPVLLALDDLQNAGHATGELLHYLTRHLSGAHVLTLATLRTGEGDRMRDALTDVAARLDVGPLPAAAVARLAAAAGQAGLTAKILALTRGHTLFVVETLHGLRAGHEGIPGSLQDAVMARVRRAGRGVENLLRAASVLGASFDPGTVARLLEVPLPVVVANGEDALAAGLLVVSGHDYEFSNDLVREVLYHNTPAPTRLAYHRQAADLLTDHPEAMAFHAEAAQDWPRAARALLIAGEMAAQRFAGEDAEDLLGRCLTAAERTGDLDIKGRALLARARALSSRGAYQQAITDMEASLRTARDAGDRRLEMLALRALGGDAPIADGRPIEQAVEHLERGLHIATSLGDRAMEADLLAWLAIIGCNRLRFDEAVERSRRAVIAARASGDDAALAAALDGRKTSFAYIGEISDLVTVLDELEPLLRRLGDMFRLSWTLFESGFPAVAAGDWRRAAAAFDSALETNTRGGFSGYAAWHVAHLGWLARLQGDYPEALALGRRAVALNDRTPHTWCGAVAAAMLGTTLLETGSRSESITALERGCELAGDNGSEAYLLRCLGPLAQASGSLEVLGEADVMVARIAAPAGSAWLVGDGAYLGVARAWLNRDEPERARAVLAPMLAAAARVPWVAPLAAGSLVDGLAAGRLGHAEESHRLLVRARDLGRRHRLGPIAAAAAAALT